MGKSKILVLVEGDKTDVKLMRHLLDVYGILSGHEIVSYHTNIYTLYNEMFRDGDPSSIDLLQNLKEHEKDDKKKVLFDQYYSDKLLIFNLDPQDPQYSPEKIKEMVSYFTESSDMGKLYINYPMVEAFYHMKSIPDKDYYSYYVTMDELKNHQYKKRVTEENRDKDYRRFAIDRKECNIVIRQNIEKANKILQRKSDIDLPDLLDVLSKQLEYLSEENKIFVLCTCAFYILDYNSNLIKTD